MDESNIDYKLSEILDVLKKQNERISKLEKKYSSDEAEIKPSVETDPAISVKIPTFTPTPSYRKSEDSNVMDTARSNYSPPKKSDSDIESVIGGKWLVKIGMFALLIGMAFFLRYAFENWIGPMGQIILGYFLGLVLLGGGEYVNRKYGEKWKNYALSLAGGGIGISYITTFAAANYYGLIDFYTSLVVSLIITFIAAVVSLRNESKGLLALSILGGFISPIILGATRLAGADYSVVIYLIAINIGVLYVSTQRPWKNINLLAMVSTYFNLLVWRMTIDQNIGFTALWIFALFFAFFTINAIYRQLVRKELSTQEDFLILVVNSIAFYTMSLTEIGYADQFRDYRAVLTLVLGGVYTLLAYTSHNLNSKDRNLMVFLTAISIIFYGLSVPLILNDQFITLAWIVQSIVVLWVGFELKSKHIRGISYILFLVALLRLVFIDLGIGSEFNSIPVLNFNFLELFASVMGLYIGTYIFYQYRSTISEEEFSLFKGAYVAVAQVITLLAITNEIYSAMDYTNLGVGFIRYLVVSLWWLLYSLITISVGTSKNSYVLKMFSVLLFYVLIAKVMFVDLSMADNLSESLTHSIIWTVAALIGLMFGFSFNSKNYRLASLIFLGVMILKLFLVDTWNLSEIYRIIAYFALGIILIVAGYIYVKYQAKIKDALL